MGVAAADFDNDGWTDLYVTGVNRNALYHNNGDGTFTDITERAGVSGRDANGKKLWSVGAAWVDYNDDGFIDIFVANDNERNFLFRNANGRTFAEVGVEATVGYTEDGLPVSSMGVDFRDLNNDGRPDLAITALGGEMFPLFLNEGHGFFSAATYQSKLGVRSLTMSGWGIGAYDFDNDGQKDLFTANSHVSENAEFYGHHKYRQPNAVFQNQGDGTFQDAPAEAGPSLHLAAAHRGSAFGDLNNDGRIDVVVSAIGSPAEILYNTSIGARHWILIQAEGRKSNRDGIGTKGRLTGQSGLVQVNQMTTAVG